MESCGVEASFRMRDEGFVSRSVFLIRVSREWEGRGRIDGDVRFGLADDRG